MDVLLKRTAIVGLLGSLAIAGGVTAGAAVADQSNEQVQPRAGAPTFSENAKGLTYGSLADANELGEEPDLTLVIADSGIEGYIYTSQLNPPDFKSPEEAVEWSENRSIRVLDVFEADGATQVGTFTIDPAEATQTTATD